MAAAMRVRGVENPQGFGMMNADTRYLVQICVYLRSSAVQIILKSYEWYYISENRQMKVKKC